MPRGFAVGRRKGNDKLLATETGHHIHGTGVLKQNTGKLPQHVITGQAGVEIAAVVKLTPC